MLLIAYSLGNLISILLFVDAVCLRYVAVGSVKCVVTKMLGCDWHYICITFEHALLYLLSYVIMYSDDLLL